MYTLSFTYKIISNAYTSRRLSLFLFFIFGILTRICFFVIEVLDKLVISAGQQRAHCGAEPVYVVVVREIVGDSGGAERASGIKRASGEIHAWLVSNVNSWTQNIPHNSATNRANPIPTGAMNVARDFSAASIKMTKTNNEVRNISIKTPCVIEVPLVNFVTTATGPGNIYSVSGVCKIEQHLRMS